MRQENKNAFTNDFRPIEKSFPLAIYPANCRSKELEYHPYTNPIGVAVKR
jgi:hypothetical protein